MASAEPAVVDDDAAAALLAPLATRRGVALAVSGGADSTALLHLWCRARARLPALPPALVLAVDHGLRPEAAAEIAAVAALAAAHDLPFRALAWDGPKPTAGLQAAARAARRRLLLDATRDAGLDTLALAHHADDQAETFLDRLARGSGVLGLSAMRKERLEDGVLVVRPLLDLPKARLVATLRAAGLSWCDDPSNADPRFGRARWRAAAPLLAALGLDRARLVATAAAMARAADALDRLVADRLAAARPHPAGWVSLDAAVWSESDAEIRLRLLARLIAAVTGAPYGPRLDALERLDADLRLAVAARRPRVATLAGARVEHRRARLWVAPEAGRAPSLDLAPGTTARWRGRPVRVAAEAPAGLRLALLGPAGRRRLFADRPPAAAPGGDPAPSAAIVETAPALWLGDRLLACPALAPDAAETATVARWVALGDFALPDAAPGGLR